MIISLIGFMGCGKSSIGKELGRLLSCRFIDLDTLIEEMANNSIANIFTTQGEEYFRSLELKALNIVFSKYANSTGYVVLSLGGGTLTHPKAQNLVKNNSVSIYLKCTEEELVANLQGTEHTRPMLQGYNLPTRIHALMRQREQVYKTVATYIVNANFNNNTSALHQHSNLQEDSTNHYTKIALQIIKLIA